MVTNTISQAPNFVEKLIHVARPIDNRAWGFSMGGIC